MRIVAEDCARKIDGAASAPAVEPSPTSAVRRDIRRSPIFLIVILPFDDRHSIPALCADDLSMTRRTLAQAVAVVATRIALCPSCQSRVSLWDKCRSDDLLI